MHMWSRTAVCRRQNWHEIVFLFSRFTNPRIVQPCIARTSYASCLSNLLRSSNVSSTILKARYVLCFVFFFFFFFFCCHILISWQEIWPEEKDRNKAIQSLLYPYCDGRVALSRTLEPGSMSVAEDDICRFAACYQQGSWEVRNSREIERQISNPLGCFGGITSEAAERVI